MSTQPLLKIGICADHGGFELKEKIISFLLKNEFQIVDFGAKEFNDTDDFPDYVIPLAKAVAAGEVFRGIAICGSGVGACIVANKISGVRAALITEHFSAHQGVEDDDMNLICLGGRVTGYASAEELVFGFFKRPVYRSRKTSPATEKNSELRKLVKESSLFFMRFSTN